MIHLITGTPGSGKTLLAVELILKNRNSEKIRPLYANIEGLNLEELRCFKLDEVDNWYDLPDGAIIVIDECQRWFRPRPNGSAVPECISRFETHRHHGHDIILITQHPGLIDRNIRKLVDRHQHMYRPFGMDHRKVFEWNTCNESPEPSQNESNALRTKLKFDKELFKYYQSASIHTSTKRIPIKQIATFVGAILVTVILGGSFVRSKLEVIDSGKQQEVPQQEDSQQSQPSQEVHVQEIAQAVASPPINQLLYRGHIKSTTSLSLMLEDAQTGQKYDLSDFDGYRKEGVEVVFYVAGTSHEFTYHSRDRELLKYYLERGRNGRLRTLRTRQTNYFRMRKSPKHPPFFCLPLCCMLYVAYNIHTTIHFSHAKNATVISFACETPPWHLCVTATPPSSSPRSRNQEKTPAPSTDYPIGLQVGTLSQSKFTHEPT